MPSKIWPGRIGHTLAPLSHESPCVARGQRRRARSRCRRPRPWAVSCASAACLARRNGRLRRNTMYYGRAITCQVQPTNFGSAGGRSEQFIKSFCFSALLRGTRLTRRRHGRILLLFRALTRDEIDSASNEIDPSSPIADGRSPSASTRWRP